MRCPLIQVEDAAPQPAWRERRMPIRVQRSLNGSHGQRGDLGAYLLGNPNSRACIGSAPSYERACPICAARLRCPHDRIAPARRPDLPLFKHVKTDKKIAIGVSTLQHGGGTGRHVAALIRKRWNTSQEQLVISTDCGFGREGLSRRIASTSAWPGRGHQHRPPASSACRKRACGAADPKLWFAGVEAVAPPPRQSWGGVAVSRQSGS